MGMLNENDNEINPTYPKFNDLKIIKDIGKNKLEDSKNTECSICLKEILPDDKIAKLNVCDHLYHENCLSKWYSYCCKNKSDFSCPLCKSVEKVDLININNSYQNENNNISDDSDYDLLTDDTLSDDNNYNIENDRESIYHNQNINDLLNLKRKEKLILDNLINRQKIEKNNIDLTIQIQEKL